MKWTFITTHLRKHGIAFFEKVLKVMALNPEDISYDRLKDFKGTCFSQLDLVKKKNICIKDFDVIYLKPIWVDKESDVFPNPIKNRNNLEKSLEKEHGKNAFGIIKKFEKLFSSRKDMIKSDLIKEAEKIFKEEEMHCLWQIMHELPASQQFYWFEKYSHFKDDVVSGTWDEIKDSPKKIKIVKFEGSSSYKKNDEIGWIRNLNQFVDELQSDMKIGINIFDTSTIDNLSWRYLQPRKIKLKNAVFFEVKTEKKDIDNVRFRNIYFRKTFQNLLVDTGAAQLKEELWWHKDRKEAKRQLMKFKELGDLFSIVVFGDRGCGKSKIIKDVFGADKGEEGIETVNCAAIPESLAESILFGHLKGSFTGADSEEDGVFGELKKYQEKTKDHGVLFLDEFHHLPMPIQSKLLVALQTDEAGYFSFKKLGSNKREKVKFQLILGTNQTEVVLCENSIVYQDFLDRVMQRKVFIPSLQNPKEIIPAWQMIWKKMGFINSVTDPLETEMRNAFKKWLISLEFPGNFRDIERLCILVADEIRLNDSEVITPEIFKKIKDVIKGLWPTFLDKKIKKEEMEKESKKIFGSDGITNPRLAEKRAKKLIAQTVLSHYNGNIDESVKNCKNFSRSTMLRWLGRIKDSEN